MLITNLMIPNTDRPKQTQLFMNICIFFISMDNRFSEASFVL